MSCATNAMTPIPLANTNTHRQPSASPSHAPSGMADTVASETPVLTTVIARPRRCAGTSWAAIARAIAQKPATAMPSSTRAPSNTAKSDATAMSKLEMIDSVVRPSMSKRRSSRGNSAAIVNPVIAPMTPVAVIACPAMPSVIARSVAMGESKLAGRNSAVTSVNVPSPIEATPNHGDRVSWGPVWSGTGAVMVIQPASRVFATDALPCVREIEPIVRRMRLFRVESAAKPPQNYASMTTGIIIGRRRCWVLTQRPTVRRIT
jgi:hypothetical protein